jgi:hypothetical protein
MVDVNKPIVKGQLSKKDLTIFHQNIRGLTINKIDDILYVFTYTQPQAMFYAYLNTI